MFAVSLSEVATVVLGVSVSIVTIGTVAAKFQNVPPIRWLLERLVMKPAGEALDRRIDGRVETAVQKALTPLTTTVQAIHYEMHPNSGRSMRDVLDRVEGTAIYTQGQVDELKEDVGDLRDRTSRLEGSIEVLKER